MPLKHLKKTLLALMALSSVAFGISASDINTNLQQAISDYGYTFDEGFSLRATITLSTATNNDKLYFTFASGGEDAANWYLYHQEKKYFGVTTSGDPGSWNAGVSSGSTTTYEGNLVVGQSTSWLYGPKSSDSVTLTIGSYATAIGDAPQYNTFLTLTSAAGDTIISSMLLDKDLGTSAFFDLNGISFNASVTEAELLIGQGGETIDLVNYVAPPAVPEPTTATLSLLALAGLAARRRRASR